MLVAVPGLPRLFRAGLFSSDDFDAVAIGLADMQLIADGLAIREEEAISAVVLVRDGRRRDDQGVGLFEGDGGVGVGAGAEPAVRVWQVDLGPQRPDFGVERPSAGRRSSRMPESPAEARSAPSPT